MFSHMVLVLLFFYNLSSLPYLIAANVTNTKFKISKCCDVNEVVVVNSEDDSLECVFYNESSLDFTRYTVYNRIVPNEATQKLFTDIYEVTTDKRPDKEILTTYSDIEKTYKSFLNEDGFLYLEYPNAFDRWMKVDRNFICVDYELKIPQNTSDDRNVTDNFKLWVTEFSTPPSTPPRFYKNAMLVSCVFLLLVLVVYALLPELRNLAGKVLMAYVVSLLFAYLLLATVQHKHYRANICINLTTATYFFLLASFCWINVMSCDIWWTFRGYATARPIDRRGENFKFLMYCLYGWGLPLVMSIAFVVINNADLRHMPGFIKPLVPQKGCFIEDGQKLVYLYAPMLVLIICNWVFFLMTAFNIWRLHRDSAMLDSSAAGTAQAHRNQRNRLFLYLKLSIIMGVNWILEVLSSLAPDFQLWVISDVYNMLMGLAIFLIFVCKKKIYRLLKARCNKNDIPQSFLTKVRSSSSNLSSSSPDVQVQVLPQPDRATLRA